MMEESMFHDLLASVGEAKEILGKRQKSSLSFIIDEPKVYLKKKLSIIRNFLYPVTKAFRS
jgi:hypothetical protein